MHSPRRHLIALLLLCVHLLAAPASAQDVPPVEPTAEPTTLEPTVVPPTPEPPTATFTDLPTLTLEPATSTLSPSETATPMPEPTATLVGTATETLTQTPTPAASSTEWPPVLFYRQDFDSDTLPGWQLGSGWVWSRTADFSGLLGTTSERAFFAGASFADLILETQLRFTGGTAILETHASPAGVYRLWLTNAGQISLYRNDTPLTSASLPAFTPQVWQNVRIAVLGGTIRVSINGLEALAYTDPQPLPGGDFGFRYLPDSTTSTVTPPPPQLLEVDIVQVWLPYNSTPPTATRTPTPSLTPVFVTPLPSTTPTATLFTSATATASPSVTASGTQSALTPPPFVTFTPSPSPTPTRGLGRPTVAPMNGGGNTILNIDTPISNSTHNEWVILSGWAFDNAGGAGAGTGISQIHIYAGASCSGTLIGYRDTATFIPRADVQATYGLDNSYRNSGFSLPVQFAPGVRSFTVCAIRSAGGLGAQATRTFNVYRARMAVDAPSPAGNTTSPVLVSGWAYDDTAGAGNGPGISQVQVYAGTGCSGTLLGTAPLLVVRDDVPSTYGLDNSYRTSGYALNITRPFGQHTITVCAIRSANSTVGIATTRTFIVRGTRLVIDTPNNGATTQNPVSIAGWAFDDSASTQPLSNPADNGTGINRVEVRAGSGCTGTLLIQTGSSTPFVARPDVPNAFWLDSSYTNVGYNLPVNFPAGTQTYTVCAYRTNGVLGAFETRTVVVPATPTRTPTRTFTPTSTSTATSTPTRTSTPTITPTDAPYDWQHVFDFTVDNGNFYAQNWPSASGTWQSGLGWVGALGGPCEHWSCPYGSYWRNIDFRRNPSPNVYYQLTYARVEFEQSTAPITHNGNVNDYIAFNAVAHNNALIFSQAAPSSAGEIVWRGQEWVNHIAITGLSAHYPSQGAGAAAQSRVYRLTLRGLGTDPYTDHQSPTPTRTPTATPTATSTPTPTRTPACIPPGGGQSAAPIGMPPPPPTCKIITPETCVVFVSIQGLNLRSSPEIVGDNNTQVPNSTPPSSNIIERLVGGRASISGRYTNPVTGDLWLRVDSYITTTSGGQEFPDKFGWVAASVFTTPPEDAQRCNASTPKYLFDTLPVVDAQGNALTPTPTATPTRTSTIDPNITPTLTPTPTPTTAFSSYKVNIINDGTGAWSPDEVLAIQTGVANIGRAFDYLANTVSGSAAAFNLAMLENSGTEVLFIRTDQQGLASVTITNYQYQHGSRMGQTALSFTYSNPLVARGTCVTHQEGLVGSVLRPQAVICNGPLTDHYRGTTATYEADEYTVVHEVGHLFDYRTGNGISTPIDSPFELEDCDNETVMGLFGVWTRGRRGWGTGPAQYTSQTGNVLRLVTDFQQNSDNNLTETAADSFLNWVYRLNQNNGVAAVDTCSLTPRPQSTTWGGPGFLNQQWGATPHPSFIANSAGIPGSPDESLPGDQRYFDMDVRMRGIFTTRQW